MLSKWLRRKIHHWTRFQKSKADSILGRCKAMCYKKEDYIYEHQELVNEVKDLLIDTSSFEIINKKPE